MCARSVCAAVAEAKAPCLILMLSVDQVLHVLQPSVARFASPLAILLLQVRRAYQASIRQIYILGWLGRPALRTTACHGGLMLQTAVRRHGAVREAEPPNEPKRLWDVTGPLVELPHMPRDMYRVGRGWVEAGGSRAKAHAIPEQTDHTMIYLPNHTSQTVPPYNAIPSMTYHPPLPPPPHPPLLPRPLPSSSFSSSASSALPLAPFPSWSSPPPSPPLGAARAEPARPAPSVPSGREGVDGPLPACSSSSPSSSFSSSVVVRAPPRNRRRRRRRRRWIGHRASPTLFGRGRSTTRPIVVVVVVVVVVVALLPLLLLP